jgi:protein-disulfide isomerase
VNRFVVIMIVAAVGLVGFIFYQNTNKDTDESTGIATSHTVGAGNSGVTLVEYGDFECPACAAFHPIIQQIKADFGDDITFQFRHFPLIQIHQNAMAAHRAAEAAGNQGKFFEMHDLIYERQQSWRASSNPSQIFEGYANELQLDMDAFRADVSDSATLATINADIAAGRELNVQATPTFFLNGEQINNEELRDFDSFKRLIEDAIKANSGQASED